MVTVYDINHAMNNDAEATLMRRDMDVIIKQWRNLKTFPTPRGWIYALRMALGMTAADLAKRMKQSPISIVSLEASEARGTIQLSTLRKAAKAMNCTVVYAVVPRYSLEHIVKNRRQRIAMKDLMPIMGSKSIQECRELLRDFTKRVKRKRVWRELD